MKIVVLSDTHIPRSSNDIPESIYEDIRSADLVLHAGDIVELEFLEKLRSIKKTVAVYGNMDTKPVRDILNSKEVVTVGKVKIGLIHGYGVPAQLSKTVRSEFGAVDAIVFGHSHDAMNVVDGKVLLFNPGSPTDKVFASYTSYGILTVSDDAIKGTIVRI